MKKSTTWLSLSFALALSPLALAQTGARPGSENVAPTAPQANQPFLPNAVITQGFDAVSVAPPAANPPNADGTCGLNAAMAGWFARNNAPTPRGTTCVFNGGGGTTFPAQSGAATSYAAMNFNSSTGTNSISTWLVTPRVNFGTGAQLSFWFRSSNTAAGANFPDRIQVRLSTAADTGTPDVGTALNDVGTFTTLLVDINPTLSASFVTCPAGGFTIGAPSGTIAGTVDGAWCQVTITQAAGIPSTGSGRLAFRYFVPGSAGPDGANSNFVGIDTFSFDEGLLGTPGLSFVKRVQTSSNVADCPTATTSVTVPRGTSVYYCYRATNTGTLALQTHNVTDTAFATPIASNLQFALAAAASSPWLISPAVPVNGPTSSAATWSACAQATNCTGAPAGATATASVAAGAVTASVQLSAASIPTLDVRALALLGLLMLGIGFIAFRRN